MCLSLRPPGSQDRAWAGSRVGQGPAFPHCTRSQHGALRKSTTLYLNLAFYLVMKDCWSVQVCSSGGARSTHQGKRRLDARSQVLPPSQTVLTLPGAGPCPSPAHREPSGVEVEGGDRACTHQRPAAASGEQLRTAASTLFPVSPPEHVQRDQAREPMHLDQGQDTWVAWEPGGGGQKQGDTP